MKAVLEILFGLLLIIVMLYLGATFTGLYTATIEFIKGGISILVILIGLGLIFLGISELKS